MEQQLLTPPEHLSSPPDFSGVRVARLIVVCIMCCRASFVLSLLAIVLSVDLRISVVFWDARVYSGHAFGSDKIIYIFCIIIISLPIISSLFPSPMMFLAKHLYLPESLGCQLLIIKSWHSSVAPVYFELSITRSMSLYVHLTDVTIIDVTTVHGIVAVFPFVNPDVLIGILTSGPETILYTIYTFIPYFVIWVF